MPDFKNTRIEYHILQSFPVTCLNRDDVGAPKSAVVGGVTRARVSSQCWKRQVRLAMRDLGFELGIRTKKLEDLLATAMTEAGANSKQSATCAKAIAEQLADDTLLFISANECTTFANYAKEFQFDASKIKPKELGKVAKKALNPSINGLDIALFGRMVAKAADMNVEAAASFSHAISTHKVSNDIDFFTALDDRQNKPGSAHMGYLEFNSATYYRYISLDLGQLQQTLGGDDLSEAVAAFTQALFIAVPEARQTSQSGASPWDFARIMVRKGQRLQVPFDKPVKAQADGFLPPSITELTSYLDKKEKLFGSIFGKIASYNWGLDEKFSFDKLIQKLKSHAK